MRVHELTTRLQVIQRSKGRSSVAAAAYRSAERLHDQRTGLTHDYTKKQGIEHSALLLPDNAPEWAHDRSSLWNGAEAKENRSNSQTAREYMLSFPHEMNAEQRRVAAYKVAQHLVERYGSAVDIAMHEPSAKGNQKNHHVHLMFTTRRFDPEQADGWAKKKDRSLDDRSKEKGEERSKGEIETMHLREHVATVMNEIAVEHSLPVFVEHLSFERRGLDREATQHMGNDAIEMQRKGEQTRIAEKNEQIRADNQRRADLENQKNVVDLTAERERRRLLKESAAREKDKQIRQTADDRRIAHYRQVQAERSEMLDWQRQKYGQQEAELQTELVSLHQSTNQTGAFGFVRFWHTVTGRRRAELDRIEVLQAEYDRIQAEKAQQQAQFEQQRQRQLEAVKAAEANREAAAERNMQVLAEVEAKAANERRQAPVYQSVADRHVQPPSPAGRYRSEVIDREKLAQERRSRFEQQRSERQQDRQKPTEEKIDRQQLARDRRTAFERQRAERQQEGPEQDQGLDDGPSFER